MGYLYLLMGVIISAAVLPAALTLLWKKQNVWAATLSPILGLACSLTAWLATTKLKYGDITVETSGENTPMLAGNVTSLLAPAVLVPLLTFGLGADNYDYESMEAIRRGDDHDLAKEAGVDLELIRGDAEWAAAEEEAEKKSLNRAAFIARLLTVILAISFLIIWPMPMFGE